MIAASLFINSIVSQSYDFCVTVSTITQQSCGIHVVTCGSHQDNRGGVRGQSHCLQLHEVWVVQFTAREGKGEKKVTRNAVCWSSSEGSVCRTECTCPVKIWFPLECTYSHPHKQNAMVTSPTCLKIRRSSVSEVYLLHV